MSNEFEGKYRIIYLSKRENCTYKGYELVIHNNGDKHYLLDGLFHREDNPAVIYSSGYKAWFIHGNHHQENGHTIEYNDREKSYYLNNKEYTEEEYCIIQKFCSHCNTKFNSLNNLMEHYKVEQIKYPELYDYFQEKIYSIYIEFLK